MTLAELTSGWMPEGRNDRTYEVFGSTYKFYTSHPVDPECMSVGERNEFMIYSAAGINRLLVSDADVCSGEALGRVNTYYVDFYVHPDAIEVFDKFRYRVHELLGGCVPKHMVSVEGYVHPPEDRDIRLTQAMAAVDQALLEQEFASLAQIVEDLRPSTR